VIYLKPEHRGRDLVRGAHVPAMLDLARSEGLRGYRVISTLGFWNGVTLLHHEPYAEQRGGPDVHIHWKAVS